MIKRINSNNFLTTPFVAVKSWELFNIENDDVVLLEPFISGSPIPDTAVAQDYIDYYGSSPILNSECDIALEQQTQDVLIYQEGLSGSGKFYPDSEPTNPDGTYKRLVYNTINRLFYNRFNDPTKILGLEYIDFPLSQTVRNMAEDFRVFNVPQDVYGDKLVPGTIQLFDTSLDDNVTIFDDGYQNLIAGYNLFSKIQEVRDFGNTVLSGSSSYLCPPIVPPAPLNLVVTSGSAILTWTGSNYQDYFSVQKSLNGLNYLEIATTTAETFTDTNVTISAFPGSTYWYQVAAVNGNGISSFSNTASITFSLPHWPNNFTTSSWQYISGDLHAGFDTSSGNFVGTGASFLVSASHSALNEGGIIIYSGSASGLYTGPSISASVSIYSYNFHGDTPLDNLGVVQVSQSGVGIFYYGAPGDQGSFHSYQFLLSGGTNTPIIVKIIGYMDIFENTVVYMSGSFSIP